MVSSSAGVDLQSRVVDNLREPVLHDLVVEKCLDSTASEGQRVVLDSLPGVANFDNVSHIGQSKVSNVLAPHVTKVTKIARKTKKGSNVKNPS